MRIKNYTDIPNEKVRHLVRQACRGIKTSGMLLTIRNSSKDRPTGRIWTSPGGIISYKGGKRRYLAAEIVVSLPRSEPCSLDFVRHGKSTLVYKGQTREAALVNIVAHEIYHHRQRLQGKRLNQAACDTFALKQLNRLGLLRANPKEVINRGIMDRIIKEDLKKNGWVWDAEVGRYISSKEGNR